MWLYSLTTGCGGGGSPTESGTSAQCGPYPDQHQSPWVLPYPVGDSYAVVQGNCNAPGHAPGSSNQYAYDFGMRSGSAVVAAGGGVVYALEEGESNDKAVKGSWSTGNYVTIQHPNGFYSGYAHLDQWGVLVEVGDFVTQGQLIARSGNSGTYNPHLHFQVGAPSVKSVHHQSR
ncbi:MAG: M23 family metallopeptidase [Thermoanaerobaculia bacterium]